MPLASYLKEGFRYRAACRSVRKAYQSMEGGASREITGLGGGAYCKVALWRRGRKEGEPEIGRLTPGNGHRFILEKLPPPALPPSEIRSWGIRKRRVFRSVSQPQRWERMGERSTGRTDSPTMSWASCISIRKRNERQKPLPFPF